MIKEIRIKLRSFDPVAELLILEDIKGILSPLIMSLDLFNRWRIDDNKSSGSRIQMYMMFVKKQGGKQTILNQVEQTRNVNYYKDFMGDTK